LDIDKLSPRLVRNTVIPILLRYRFVPTGWHHRRGRKRTDLLTHSLLTH
jgi:hypothetical protein